MFKLYNSQSQIASDLSKFVKFVFPTISKPNLKVIPDIEPLFLKSKFFDSVRITSLC